MSVLTGPVEKGQRYHISLKNKEVYETSELYLHCSVECLMLSKLYAAQLSDTPVHTRTAAENRYTCVAFIVT